MANGYSLHIGLNLVDPAHYNGWDGRLKGCEADARDMAAIAQAAGYSERKMLLTGDATSARVISEVVALAKKLEAGDILLLSYSGHGGQIPDESGEEDDRYDETWCLYDRQLIDDEIYRLLGKFKPGVRVLVLSDSCHSGTVTRMRVDAGGPGADQLVRQQSRSAAAIGQEDLGDDVRPRLAPLDVTMDAYNEHKGLYLALQSASAGAESTPPQARVILLSGCMDNQVSLDGANNGMFTGTLKKVWNAGAFNGGYNLFHQTIVSRMPPSQTPNFFRVGEVGPDFVNQKPFTI
jgi:hypothetical protein